MDAKMTGKDLYDFMMVANTPVDGRYQAKHRVGEATLTIDVEGKRYVGDGEAGPLFAAIQFKAGQRVRVVMASRFGDLGITDVMGATYGYDTRVRPDTLIDCVPIQT